MSINVEYNNKEINQIILENVFKMLERRGLIKSWSTEFDKVKNDVVTKNIFQVELIDKSQCSTYLVNAKLNSIVQGTPLADYLSNNIDIHKIIVASDVSKKVVKQIVTEYKNAEFFFENEMLEDLPSKSFIPKHEIITPDEKANLLGTFTETELSRILLTDMMARYYGAKVGDIMRITRPSYIAGQYIFYRRVVQGSWDVLFEP